MSDHEHLEAKRLAILAAAAEAFDAHGYAATTIDEVAARAGISKGSVYNYFRSKQELFTQLFVDSIEPTEADSERMIEDLSAPAATLARLIGYWYRELSRHQKLGRLTLEFWANAARQEEGGELNRLLRQTHRRWVERIKRILARGIETGDFRADLDLERAAWTLVGQFDGLMLHRIMDIGMEVDEALLASLETWIMTALCCPDSPRPREVSDVCPEES